MPYYEKRDGKPTGRVISEVKGSGFKKRAHETYAQAKGREVYIRATGEDLPGEDVGSGKTFKSVAQELKDAGGPGGTWANGRDKSVTDRLDFLCALKFGALPIEGVTYTEVEKVVADLAKRPGQQPGSKLSPATINRYLTSISTVMTYAELKDYIPRTPTLPWQKEPKKKQATYSDTMLRGVTNALRAEGHEVDAFLVDLLALTGMRVGELLNLKPQQLEDGFVSLDDPEAIKNEDPREVLIGEENEARLRVLIRENKLPTYHQLYIHLRSAVEKCGYDVKRIIHALRHTRATRTVADEQDIQIAQELLGHRSINTTLKYRHVSKEARRARAKKHNPQLGKKDETNEGVQFPETKSA